MMCVSYIFDCFRSCSTYVQLGGGEGEGSKIMMELSCAFLHLGKVKICDNNPSSNQM
jgi:hypothetical protein